MHGIYEMVFWYWLKTIQRRLEQLHILIFLIWYVLGIYLLMGAAHL